MASPTSSPVAGSVDPAAPHPVFGRAIAHESSGVSHWVVSIGMALFGALLLGTMIRLGKYGGGDIAMGAFGGFLLLVGVWSMIKMPSVWALYEGGLCTGKPPKQVDTPLGNLEMVTFEVRRNLRNGKLEYELELKPPKSGGISLRYEEIGGVNNPFSLAVVMDAKQCACKAMAARYASEIAAGQRIDWCGWSLTAEGIERVGTVIRYDQIERATLDDATGEVDIRKVGEDKPAIKLHCAVPNFFPGWTYLETRLGIVAVTAG